MKKILVVTGSRGEWGYLRPILELLKNLPGIEFDLLVTNMHLLASHGNSYEEIENDGFEIKHKIDMSFSSDNYFTHVKGMGVLMQSISDVLLNNHYDVVLVSGDRGEQLIATICASYCYIPVAHIQAGEVSGNIDGVARHAIGKLAHVHFASNEDAANRLINLGEQDFRIHLVGAPQIDDMLTAKIQNLGEIGEQLHIELNEGYILAVLHPVTENLGQMRDELKAFTDALLKIDRQVIFIMPNNDVGHEIIHEAIVAANVKKIHRFKNLNRTTYLSLLRHCSCIVGNSSSGILEAATYRTPAVNIGRRQQDRFQGHNVVNCEFLTEDIISAVKLAIDPLFKTNLQDKPNDPYGDGTASTQISKILRELKTDRNLLIKELTV